MVHLKAIFWSPKLLAKVQLPKKIFCLKHVWFILRHGDANVLGMFEKDLSNARIIVFFGQEQKGARHSTLISTKDSKKPKSIAREHRQNYTEYKFSGETTQNQKGRAAWLIRRELDGDFSLKNFHPKRQQTSLPRTGESKGPICTTRHTNCRQKGCTYPSLRNNL